VTYPIAGLIGPQSTASIVAAAICALGVAVGVWARDSKGRAIAWAAIILGLVLLYVYLFSAAFGPHLEAPETEALRGASYGIRRRYLPLRETTPCEGVTFRPTRLCYACPEGIAT